MKFVKRILLEVQKDYSSYKKLPFIDIVETIVYIQLSEILYILKLKIVDFVFIFIFFSILFIYFLILD